MPLKVSAHQLQQLNLQSAVPISSFVMNRWLRQRDGWAMDDASHVQKWRRQTVKGGPTLQRPSAADEFKWKAQGGKLALPFLASLHTKPLKCNVIIC